jgi:integrase/recombinase XerD
MVVLATVTADFLNRPGYANSTLKSYELTLMPLLKKHGRIPIELLTREILEEYLESLSALSYTTHRRHQAILQSLLNFALERGNLKANPIAHLKLRKPNPAAGESHTDEVVRYLNPEQLQALYLALKPDPRMYALVILLHRTGARIAEVLALNLADLDLNDYKFQVIGKGNKRRWCFYSEDAAEALERYVQHYRHAESPALFTARQPQSNIVSRLSYTTVYKAWKQLTLTINLLNDSRIHDLRHTFATERVGLMGIEELRALLGHQNIQTTLRYQKVTSARAEEVAKYALGVIQGAEQG